MRFDYHIINAVQKSCLLVEMTPVKVLAGWQLCKILCMCTVKTWSEKSA